MNAISQSLTPLISVGLRCLSLCFLGMVAVDGAENELKALWVIDPSQGNRAEQTMLATLQGLTAKSKTPIWLDEPNGLHAVVRDSLVKDGVSMMKASSVWKLVEHFRENLHGYVVYREDDDSINVATSLAGLKGALAVTEALAERCRSLGLAEIEDVHGMSEMDAYARWGKQCSKSVIAVQDEKKHRHLRDWVVAERAFCFYGLDSEQRAAILSNMEPNHQVLGWEGEHGFVKAVSEQGGMVIPADWSWNLSVTSRLSSKPASQKESVAKKWRPAEKGERIVAFVMSDGDNLQWMGGPFVARAGFWASPQRGKIPMTWEMPPLLEKWNPRGYAHFLETATPKDAFIAGPSGAGYVFPSHHSDLASFTKVTASTMQSAQLRISTLLNSGGSMNDAKAYLEQPEIDAVVYKGWYYDSEKGRILWHRDKPCVSYRYLLWEPRPDKSPEGVAKGIATLPADPTQFEDSFILINVHAWSFKDIGGPMEAVRRTVDLLPDRTRVVTVPEMIWLLRHHRQDLK